MVIYRGKIFKIHDIAFQFRLFKPLCSCCKPNGENDFIIYLGHIEIEIHKSTLNNNNNNNTLIWSKELS